MAPSVCKQFAWLLLLLGGLAPALRAEDAPVAPAAVAPAPVSAERKSDAEDYELFKLFADALDQVERNYVQKVDRRELMEAAVKGMVSRLDQYSSYIPPQELDKFKTSVENEFGGVGITVSTESGELVVMTPLYATPAYRAGIRGNDKILEIDGRPTKGITLEQAVKQMKGKLGAAIQLKLEHAADQKQEQITLTRELIRVDSVLGDRRKPDDTWNFLLDDKQKIGYIRLTNFSRHTSDDLRQALLELTAGGMRGLILDLRWNGGGLLSTAVEVSDLFVAEGRIVSTAGRNTPERQWDAKKDGTFEGFPMAVLVNHYSASASEILAACLQDHQRAVVIGERTWGKGSVQNVIELEDGKSALKLTTAGYRRPSGKNIHRLDDAKDTDEWGVKPNEGFEVALTDDEIQATLADRRLRDVIKAPPKDGAPAEAVRPLDKPLQKAVEYLAQKTKE